MGCSVSRLELRAGRGSTESGLRSIKHKIVDEVSRCDRGIVTCTYSSDTAKLLAKESVGRNSVVAPPNDYKKPPQPPVTENVRRGLEAKSIKSTNYEENNYDGELEGDGGGKGGGSVISDFDGALWMASPSFREYCLPEVDGDDSDDDSVVKGIATVIVKDNPDLENISNKENVGRDMEIIKDGNHPHHHDGSSGRSMKRRRNLMQVLTMRRPAAVRNLFHVNTCYNNNHLAAPTSQNGTRKSH